MGQGQATLQSLSVAKRLKDEPKGRCACWTPTQRNSSARGARGGWLRKMAPVSPQSVYTTRERAGGLLPQYRAHFTSGHTAVGTAATQGLQVLPATTKGQEQIKATPFRQTEGHAGCLLARGTEAW